MMAASGQLWKYNWRTVRRPCKSMLWFYTASARSASERAASPHEQRPDKRPLAARVNPQPHAHREVEYDDDRGKYRAAEGAGAAAGERGGGEEGDGDGAGDAPFITNAHAQRWGGQNQLLERLQLQAYGNASVRERGEALLKLEKMRAEAEERAKIAAEKEREMEANREDAQATMGQMKKLAEQREAKRLAEEQAAAAEKARLEEEQRRAAAEAAAKAAAAEDKHAARAERKRQRAAAKAEKKRLKAEQQKLTDSRTNTQSLIDHRKKLLAEATMATVVFHQKFGNEA